MNVASHTVIAGRYELVDRLGTGAMGEVWRARDTRFESRLVAIKLLREDETLKEDALNRDRLVVQIEQQAARGGIAAPFAIEAIAAALDVSDIDGLKAKAASAFGSDAGITPGAVFNFFDQIVNDPAFNDNARIRAKMRRLFRDEANTVANLRHDNVVSIFDYGDHEGNPFLVMDYIEGRTLYQLLQAREVLSESRRLQFIEDLCAGLGYAHRHKLVHRDIKPANLIIATTTGSLKILDFGVVRRIGSKSTIGVPIGTFCYMSPEQTRGDAALDHRSDIFAVGLVFYELMSGRKAFPPSKSITDLVARIQRDPPAPISELVPSISPAIEEIINKAIEKRPDDRYQDLAIMGREIARIRAPLEAAEQAERTMLGARAKPPMMPLRPPAATVKAVEPGVAELLAHAERAFASGDDQSAVDFCGRILAQKPGFPPALSLLARAEARRWDIRLREVLDSAEKEMAREDLKAAQATLARAREIDPSSPRIRDVEQKLRAAIAAHAAALERAERGRIAQLTPPLRPAVDLDADAITRPLSRAPLAPPVLPPTLKSPFTGLPPVSSPSPPAPPAKPASSSRRRRVVNPAEDTAALSHAPAAPVFAPLPIAGPPPFAPPPAAVEVPRATPRATDPAGERLLVRPVTAAPPQTPPASAARRAAARVGDIPPTNPPQDQDIPTRRVDSASIHRAVAGDPHSVAGAVRPPRIRSLTPRAYAAVAVALLAPVIYLTMAPGRLTTPAAPSPAEAVQPVTPPAASTPVLTNAGPKVPMSISDAPPAAARASGGDEQAVRVVVDAYVAGLSSRDVDEIAKVRDLSPATRAGLQKRFETVSSQTVALTGVPRITIDGRRAQVDATLRYDVERVAGQRAQTDVPVTLVLNRIRNEWRIVRVAP